MNPNPPQSPPPAGPAPEGALLPAEPLPERPRRKSSLAFVGVLLALYLPGMAVQALALLPGLAWSEVFAFFLPAVAAAEGSNLRSGSWLLMVRRPRVAQLGLAVAIGGAGFFLGGGIMSLWMLVLPHRLIEMQDLSHLFGGPPAERIALALLASVAAPICEETAFRGYVLSALRTRFGPPRAILIAALLFAAMHLDPVRFPALILLGVLFGWLAWRSGSLWPAVLAHATNNGVASVLASTSGFSASEGGSTLSQAGGFLLVIALGAAALWPLALAYRAVTPAPPPLDLEALRRDPSDPDVRFRFRRVPRELWSAATVGFILLILITGVAGRTERPSALGSPEPARRQPAHLRETAQEGSAGVGHDLDPAARPERRGQGGGIDAGRQLGEDGEDPGAGAGPLRDPVRGDQEEALDLGAGSRPAGLSSPAGRPGTSSSAPP